MKEKKMTKKKNKIPKNKKKEVLGEGPDSGLDSGDSIPEGNTSSKIRSRTLLITLNNPTKQEIDSLNILSSEAEDWLYQFELGSCWHLHWGLKFENQRYISALKKILPRARIDKSEIQKDSWKRIQEYCSKKKNNVSTTYRKNKKTYLKQLRLWQWSIIHILNQKPDDRTIYWVYDKEGNKGKTKLAKHIVMSRENAIYLNGGAKYMKYSIMKYVEENKKGPQILMLDIPRSKTREISYSGIEEIKNGIFFNTHYESKMVVYEEPHVIVFSNSLPKMKEMSQDRWKIIKL